MNHRRDGHPKPVLPGHNMRPGPVCPGAAKRNPTAAQSITDYVLSGHAYLRVHTLERARFVQDLKEIAAGLPPKGRPIFVWSPATGWRDAEGQPAKTADGRELGQTNPARPVRPAGPWPR